MQRLGIMALFALTLAMSALARADDTDARPAPPEAAALAPGPAMPDAHGQDSNAPGGKPDGTDAVRPSPRVARPHVRHPPGHGIDETVRRLTRGLDLDAAQQVKLREILVDEQLQVRKLRANTGAGVDWPAATAAVVDQTKARIRAMLNDEQKQKYSVDVPRDGLAPAQADLQHWIDLQDAKRVQGDGTAK